MKRQSLRQMQAGCGDLHPHLCFDVLAPSIRLDFNKPPHEGDSLWRVKHPREESREPLAIETGGRGEERSLFRSASLLRSFFRREALLAPSQGGGGETGIEKARERMREEVGGQRS